ncbi:MAG TPA: CsbD family protein [Actinomycetales bacterium]|uniref:CsbD family protein n=1 Tax=uncultured Corynebacterium sp. TaxID=159447 RepID=UPI0017622E70|nr:CsbD family protein [uncultured Corynebacterium sp.]HHU44355.1 CsbD family protein [Actinomycetales bacterium]
MADFKNKAEELGGKAKEAAGNLTNNDEMRNEGRGEQSKAEMKQGMDNARDKAEEGLGKLRGDNR